jgi:mannose-1-phosphate guanylyltransferase
VAADDIYVVTNECYSGLAREQLNWISPDNIIAEPCERNTAPAIALACIHLHRQGANGVMAVLPADHTIQDSERFRVALRQTERAAREGHLVMLGIEPHSPHTGYGYIKCGTSLFPHDALPVYRVERSHEKPDLSTAQRFITEGGYYWNAGIFVCRADKMLDEIAR